MGNFFKRAAAALAVVVAAFAVNSPMTLTAEAASVGGCSGSHSGNELNDVDFSAGSTLSTGTYYLTGALTITNEIEIAGKVTVCLNGQNISAENSRVFKIAGSGSLTLCNCKEAGAISGGAVGDGHGGGVYVEKNGTFTMKGGIISGNSAKEGAGVYVNNGGKFEMTGGEISDNTASHQGGGVYVNDTGTFTMTGGEISGNKAIRPQNEGDTTFGGGGVYTAGKFTMNGNGCISGNIADNCFGGGICVSGVNAKFTLSSGTISDNNAIYGGGVHVSDQGTVEMNGGTIGDKNDANGGGGISMSGGAFKMSGGTISSNKSKYGGGAYVTGGTLTISSSGTLSNNTANSDGGGVYLGGGNFNMTGGTLSENSATNNGGGVFLNNGDFNMSGGKITENTAKLGNCVYFNNANADAAMTLSGKVTITSNSDSNVYLKTGKTITIGSNFAPTEKIGIHPEIAPADCKAFVPAAEFANGVKASNISDKFKADKEKQIVVYKDSKIQLMGEHNYDKDNWITDDNNHWHKCTICEEKVDNAKHIWDSGTITKQPTPTEEGEIKYVCTVCLVEKFSPLRLNSPSSSSGSGGNRGNSSGNKVTRSDDDNSAPSVPKNPPTGHSGGVLAALTALTIAALAAASARKRR